MLNAIVRKEFLAHVLTLRFIAGTIFCIGLYLASALVLTADYRERVDAYQAAVAHHREQLDDAWVFSQVVIGVERPPQPMSLICRGVDSALPTTIHHSLLGAPSASGSGTGRNPLLVVFPRLDMTTVVQVIMSLLALLFAYDAVSGERQRGTLALILANQLPRSTLLLGKYLGAMAVLLPLLLLGTAISLMVMLASEYVRLTTSDWLVLLLMLIVSAGYLSLVWLAGLVISALTRHARTSLVVALFLWVVAVLIAPQAASAAAAALRPLPSQRAQAMAEQQVSEQADQQIYSYANHHPMPLSIHEQRFNEARGSLYSGDIPVLFKLYAAPREYVEWALAGTRHGVPILVEAASTIQEMRSQAVLRMVGQADLARWLRRLTPAAAYYDSVAVLCATEHGAYLRFWQAVAAQRHQLIEYARARDGLGYRFFTREQVLATPPYAELAALEEQGQVERLQLLLGTDSKEAEPLDLSEMPQLASVQVSLGERISEAIPDLVLLLVLNMVMILLAAIIFSRADVRVS